MIHAKIESMEPEHSPDQIERNPVAHQKHRKETLWQITVPIIVGGLVLLTLSVLSIFMEAGDASRWADISLIWLIIPVMFGTLLSFFLLVISIYATVKVIQVLPRYSFRLTEGLKLVGYYVHLAGDRAVEPFVRIKSTGASLSMLNRQIRTRKKRTT